MCEDLNLIFRMKEFKTRETAGEDVSALQDEFTLDLTLVKWYFINNSAEFTLELKDGVLVSISQRSLEAFFPHLADGSHLKEVLENAEKLLKKRFQEKIQKLPKHCKN